MKWVDEKLADYFLLWDTIDRMLWGAAFALLLICGLLYVFQGRKKNTSEERLIMYGFGSLFFGFLFYRIIINVSQQLFLSSNGYYLNGAFYSEVFSLLTGDFPFISTILGRFCYIIFTLSFAFFFYTFERVIKKSNYLITSVMILNIPLLIILPYGITCVLFSTLTFSMAMMISLGILIYYAIKSDLEFKAIASLIALAMMLAGGSTTFANPDLLKFGVISIYSAPITMIIAACIGIAPSIIAPEYFSKALCFWVITACLVMGLLIYLTTSFLFWALTIGLELYFFVNTFIYLILDVFLFRIIFKNILKERKGIPTETTKESINLLGMFSKPKNLTEKEVSMYRDKAVCLVCKGEIDGFSYICQSCKALYCEKCVQALINLENICWACDSRLDKSKPSNKSELKEEDLTVGIPEKGKQHKRKWEQREDK